MRYYVDGYNLIFSLGEERSSLEQQRETLLGSLSSLGSGGGLHLIVVFDAVKSPGPARRSHRGPLEVVYTAHGESADDYILGEIGGGCAAECTVVSDDRRLVACARELGAHTLGRSAFFQRLAKKQRRGGQGEHKVEGGQGHPDFQRWIDIFEKRLEDK